MLLRRETPESAVRVSVVLAGEGIHLCSIQIDAHNSELMGTLSDINHVENVRINQKLESLRYLFAASANANVDVAYDEAMGSSTLNSEYKQIVEQYRTGGITKNAYFNRNDSGQFLTGFTGSTGF